jgi:hypothetical protein
VVVHRGRRLLAHHLAKFVVGDDGTLAYEIPLAQQMRGCAKAFNIEIQSRPREPFLAASSSAFLRVACCVLCRSSAPISIDCLYNNAFSLADG